MSIYKNSKLMRKQVNSFELKTIQNLCKEQSFSIVAGGFLHTAFTNSAFFYEDKDNIYIPGPPYEY